MSRLTARLDDSGLPGANPLEEQHELEEPNEYGLHEPVGDPMGLKEKGWTRIKFHNQGGVSAGAGGNIESKTLEPMKEEQVDHFVMTETHLNTSIRRVRAKLHNHCGRMFGPGEYRLVTAASSVGTAERQRGGVMGITRGPLHGRVLETGRDDMGRWVYTKFHTSRNQNITIIGAYQPINKTAKQPHNSVQFSNKKAGTRLTE